MADIVEAPLPASSAAVSDASSMKKSSSVPPPVTPSFSLSIWPPSQRTRDAVVLRLIQTLTTPSVLTKRYGSFPTDSAEDTARRIEDDAFRTASDRTAEDNDGDNDDDGMDILQIYSKEISKEMLQAVKANSTSSAAPAVSANGSAAAAPTEAATEGGNSGGEDDSVA